MFEVPGKLSRDQVLRMTRLYSPAIAACALSADQATRLLVDRIEVDPRGRFASKIAGQLFIAAWTESVRSWIDSTDVPSVVVHDPYEWVELSLHGQLHLRMQRDHPDNTRSKRRSAFRDQVPDPELPLNGPSTNLQIVSVHSELDGHLRNIRLDAPYGASSLWDSIFLDVDFAHRQLVRWRARSVPWLNVAEGIENLLTTKLASGPQPSGLAVSLGSKPAGATFRPKAGSNIELENS